MVVVEHADNVDTTTEAQSSAKVVCNRRLSRAAREILKRKLLLVAVKQQLQLSSSSSSSDNDNHKKSQTALKRLVNAASENDKDVTVWDLLDELLVVSNHNNNNVSDSKRKNECILDPNRDLLRHQEQHVNIVPAVVVKYGASRSLLVGERRTTGHARKWYQCGLCNKTFTSRYYLDQHLDQQHATDTADTDNNYSCPAVDWCRIFSMSDCQVTALALEPFYYRGSDGNNHNNVAERWTVQRKLAAAAHAVPCTAADMQDAHDTCQRTVVSCFDDNESNTASVQSILCGDVPKSCHGRLHDLWKAGDKSSGSSLWQQVHEWQDEWTYYSQQHDRISWWGVLLLLGLVLGYSVVGVQRRAVRPRRTGAGTRLLRKRASQSSSSPSSWWGSATSGFSSSKTKTH